MYCVNVSEIWIAISVGHSLSTPCPECMCARDLGRGASWVPSNKLACAWLAKIGHVGQLDALACGFAANTVTWYQSQLAAMLQKDVSCCLRDRHADTICIAISPNSSCINGASSRLSSRHHLQQFGSGKLPPTVGDDCTCLRWHLELRVKLICQLPHLGRNA